MKIKTKFSSLTYMLQDIILRALLQCTLVKIKIYTQFTDSNSRKSFFAHCCFLPINNLSLLKFRKTNFKLNLTESSPSDVNLYVSSNLFFWKYTTQLLCPSLYSLCTLCLRFWGEVSIYLQDSSFRLQIFRQDIFRSLGRLTSWSTAVY